MACVQKLMWQHWWNGGVIKHYTLLDAPHCSRHCLRGLKWSTKFTPSIKEQWADVHKVLLWHCTAGRGRPLSLVHCHWQQVLNPLCPARAQADKTSKGQRLNCFATITKAIQKSSHIFQGHAHNILGPQRVKRHYLHRVPNIVSYFDLLQYNLIPTI